MGKTPKGSLLRHGNDHLRPGPGTVVEHTVISFLPNGPSAKSHNRVEPTTALSWNFEPARAVPLMEGSSARGEALREAEARKDSPPQLEGLGAPNQKETAVSVGSKKSATKLGQEEVSRGAGLRHQQLLSELTIIISFPSKLNHQFTNSTLELAIIINRKKTTFGDDD
uniref:Uncharacterized protein n=1 Tax=Oryza glumipatula TaxID=40148 RepID=A0A0E0B1B0_9ORYZ